ncbi:transglycosylase domain-containing protein [Streptacidiphilus griseoplanus]|uniref:transglycosylase domain-containing protein n=1 Tax=Peterkaempfera griseoplana TaxID=66896 RepID=UPI001FE1DF94|nr:transglycosylase domain-containing protein [Peterkaempfera griseoplana]
MTRAEMRKAAKRGSGAAGGPAGRAAGPPPKKRFIDYPRWGKSGVRHWLPSWRQVLSTFLILFAGMVGAVGYAYAHTAVPSLNAAVKQQNNIYQWSDGSPMATTGETNRQIVPLDHISKAMQYAAISAENATFESDHGIDPKGIARAVFNMAKGGETQGGSTITQQYVKNAFLSQDQTVSRKLKELFVTLKVDKTLSKDQILEGYLNTSWFGRGSYGIQAASKAYYNTDASNLDACHAALLAALLKGAGYYDPSISADNHARAKQRWSDILDNMVRFNHLSQADRNKCTKFPEPIKEHAASNLGGQTGYLVTIAKQYVIDHGGVREQDLDRGGYTIRTTFDKKKVDALAATVKQVSSTSFDPKKRPKFDSDVQIGGATVEPGTGKLLAIYGGPDYLKHFTNNANSTGVPVGSTFKPIVLASAMQYGVQTKLDDQGQPTRITPESRYNGNDLIKIRQLDGTYVLNKDGSFFRQKNESTAAWGYIPLRKAMLYSVNSPFVQLGEDVGLDKVADMAQKVGLLKSTLAYRNASFSIGTSTPSAIRMANAYATFAASGEEVDPYSVISVTHEGAKLKGFEAPQPKRVMDAAVADTVTDVLKDVIWKDGGTGNAAKALGRPSAGKTGTTDDNKSAWFVGYTPQLSTAIAMWREKPGKSGLESMNGLGTGNPADSVHGGSYPTEIWTKYMSAVLNGVTEEPLPVPGDLGALQVDESGAPSTVKPSPSASVSSAPPSATPTVTSSNVPPSATTTPDPATSGPGNGTNGGWNGGGGLLSGGGNNGGGNGGSTPTPTASATASPTVSSPSGRPGGNNNGGLLGGSTGSTQAATTN